MSLNEQVALALGWTNTVGDWFEPIGKPGDEVYGHRKADLPDYEHDIKAAWELVPLISMFAIINDNKEHVSVEFLVGEEMDDAEGDTAPEAICRAFLATREESK